MNNISILKKVNNHPRDNQIQFQEVGHKYTILSDISSKYTSVTTFIHSHFPVFNSDKIIDKMMNSKSWKEGHKYWNMNAVEIKNQWSNNGMSVSQLGTNLHFKIECFMNNTELPTGYSHYDLLNYYYKTSSESIPTKEWNYFLQFITDFPNLIPYRTEWTIFHEELKLAGSIDMVYEKEDGTLSIYDWKRVKNITTVNSFDIYANTDCICHIPDSNFWHYALQLNIYKSILEEKYNKIVNELVLIRLHPDAPENSYELIPIPILSVELKDLFLHRKNSLL